MAPNWTICWKPAPPCSTPPVLGSSQWDSAKTLGTVVRRDNIGINLKLLGWKTLHTRPAVHPAAHSLPGPATTTAETLSAITRRQWQLCQGCWARCKWEATFNRCFCSNNEKSRAAKEAPKFIFSNQANEKTSTGVTVLVSRIGHAVPTN